MYSSVVRQGALGRPSMTLRYPGLELAKPPTDFRRVAIPAGRALIEGVVAQAFGVEARDLRRTTRGRARVALARQAAMYLAHTGFGLNLTNAGELFSRDRTTVAYACAVIEDRRDDPVFDRTMDLLAGIVTVLADRSAASSEGSR